MPRSNAEHQLTRLRNQINWVTRISTALSATDKMEDIVSIVLAGLLSPTGLGYSRVLYFEHDDSNLQLAGRYALAHESAQSIDDLQKDLESEDRFLQGMSRHMDDGDPGAPLEIDQFDTLESGAPWLILFQKLNPESEATERIKRLRFRIEKPAPNASPANLFAEIARRRRPQAFRKHDLAKRLPLALAAILPDHFAALPIHTVRGLRAVILVDRHLDPNPAITDEDLRELDWFGRQASLAVENSEIRHDLSRSIRDLKEFEQMKTNFLSIISHELRTPLTAMSGFVDLILDERVGAISENQRQLLARVQKNTGHLIHLVNDLIEVAETEIEGSIAVRIQPVEPLTVYMDTLPRLEQRRRQNNVRVVPEIDGNVPRILADERALGRIFFHLIDNAIKFSPAGSTVTVRFRVEEGEFYADICDKGMGIAQEHLDRIFDQFYQVDNTLTRGHEGLGLGLAVTRLLLRATRGRIDVTSSVGEGSIFTIVFPVYDSPEILLG